jgi:NH3-dependent NAD+ synthetase
VVVIALPVAVGIAILRYRLYDIDRLINRTLVYGLLTALLGGVYGSVVLGLGQLLGRDSSLVVAAATLAVAALFQPARRRIQAVVDRRFNRRKHDAAKTVEAFSARLRDEVDLDALSAELLAVVDQRIQPTRASLWLRPSHKRPLHTGT